MWYRIKVSNFFNENNLLKTEHIFGWGGSEESNLDSDDIIKEENIDKIDDLPTNNNWVESAKSWLGTPYVFGGDSKKGIDCSAFIQKILPDKNLPRTAREQMQIGSEIPIDDPSSWSQGDRVYFDMGPRLGSGNNIADHTGVYLGNNQFIQASSSKGVTISDISPGSFYFKKLIGVRR